MSMSKQIGSREHGQTGGRCRSVVCSLATLLCLAAVLFETCLSGSAQRTAQGPVAAATARNAALVAATQEVLKETSEIRELSILRPVQSGTLSRPEIESMIVKNFDEETTPAQSHATEVTLKKLGLVPSDFQLRPFIIRLLTEQVAGYYDPKTQRFHVADWIDLNGQKPVMAHELTHALQDQHFNLRRFEHWPKGDSDAELAAHALIEGDASLAMLFYITKDPARMVALMKSLGGLATASEEINKAPRALRESLLFPYQEGLAWTQKLYKQGGWALVSKAFSDLPQSTEQVIHDRAYFAQSRDVPSVITMPAAAGTIDQNDFGEFGTRLFLYQHLKDRDAAIRAAAGWDGDRYVLAKTPGGRGLAWVSVWDTPLDAAEFVSALDDVMFARFKVKATPVTANGTSIRRFTTPTRVIDVYSRGIGGRPVVFYVDVATGSSSAFIDLSKVQVTAR